MAEHYQLRCRECGKLWGNQPRSFCDECLSLFLSLELVETIGDRASGVSSSPSKIVGTPTPPP